MLPRKFDPLSQKTAVVFLLLIWIFFDYTFSTFYPFPSSEKIFFYRMNSLKDTKKRSRVSNVSIGPQFPCEAHFYCKDANC